MCKSLGFFKGLILGTIAGCFLCWCVQNPVKMKRKAKKCTNAVEDLVDNVHYMFR